MAIKLGQVLEFVHPINVDGRIIERGSRACVGHILTDLMEPKRTLVLLGAEKATTIVVDHHVAGIHCRIVSEGT